jgi:secreted protein with Ig-like and vWFA domain/anti-sigma factor RsiW
MNPEPGEINNARTPMKITAESPELTAYALGELSPEDRLRVEEAIAANPSLQAEIDGIRGAVSLLETELAAEAEVSLSPEQRRNILAVVESPSTETLEDKASPGRPNWLSGWIAGWGAKQWSWGLALSGAVALLCAVAIWHQPSAPARDNMQETSDENVFRYGENRRMIRETAKSELKAQVDSAKDARPPVSDLPTLEKSKVSKLENIKEVKVRFSNTPEPPQLSAPISPVEKSPADSFGVPLTSKKAAAGGQTAENRILGQGLGGGLTGDSAAILDLRVTPAAPAGGVAVQSSPSTDKLQPASTPLSAEAKSAQQLSEAPRFYMNNQQLIRRYGVIPQSATPGSQSAESAALGKEYKLQIPADAGAATPNGASAGSERGRYGASAAGAGNFSLAYQTETAPSGPVPSVKLRTEAREAETLSDASLARRGALPGQSLAPAVDAYRQEAYPRFVENPFQDIRATPLSTFSLDVDTASYANLRRFLREGVRPPVDAVRIEEMVNYFPYTYPAPHDGKAFGVQVEVADCPWNMAHRLVRIAIKAREVDRAERPHANLVFLIDVSGSMEPENKLPLVKQSLHLLLDKLNSADQVGIVTYAGEVKVAMEPTAVTDDGRSRLLAAIDALRAGHGTYGSGGIQRAYEMATNHFAAGGINRVLLCTDGDFNIGITSREELLGLISEQAKTGVFLSVLGYGMDNYKDATMELLADRGNGNYAYIDSFREAQKVLIHQMEGTLVTVAKDVKAQVEFNPARVQSWRQIGYEKRRLADRDFNDDSKDAGEVGAGHSITVLYEIVNVPGHQPGVDPLRYAGESKPAAARDPEHPDELLNLKLRYKEPDGAKSKLIEVPVKDRDESWEKTSADFKFAAAVAGFGQWLRDSSQKGDTTPGLILQVAEQGLGEDREGWRAEFIDLVRAARKIMGN